jgi:hypothetical protein
VTRGLQPLTEQILSRLPWPRILWIATWALVPWLNAAANLLLGTERSAVWEQSALLVVLNYAALSFGVVITLWGSGRLARQVETLRAATSNALEGDASEPFRGMSSVAGPLVLSAAAAVVFGVSGLVRDGWGSALLRGGTWFILGVALWTFVWAYGCLLLGLHRLGRERLVPDAMHVDPGLGLQPLGRVASTGLWMLLVWLVPVLLTALSDVYGVAIGLLVLTAALGTFFFALDRVHRQMVGVKEGELAVARDLYAQAYEPVHKARTLEALEEQRSLLSAADALEKRASAIHEWPIDEGTLARVLTITTSVIAMMIGRLILDPFGL